MPAWLIEFIRATAWEMEPQQLFGSFHLTYLVVGLAVCVVAAFALRNLGPRGNRVLLTTLGIALVVSEVYKQLFWVYAIGYEQYGGYVWINLPFHLCSMPLYVLPFVAFLREGRLQQALYVFLASYCFLGGLISVVLDGGLLRTYWMMTLHSLNWHLVLVFVGLYLGWSGRAGATQKAQARDAAAGRRSTRGETVGRWAAAFARGACVFAVLAVVAFCLNLSLWEVSRGTCDMFFLGPAPMNMPVFVDIEAAVGRPLTTLIYLVSLTAASCACWLGLTHLPGTILRITQNRGDFVG